MNEHIILVAFDVAASDRETAERVLTDLLFGVREDKPTGNRPYVDSWWVAEDDRHDGSDNHSAVFVPLGSQHQAEGILAANLEG